MQFTTVRSKEKDYYIYLKSEIRFTTIRSTKTMLASYLEVEKSEILVISSLTNTVAAISTERKVDPCYLETKKCSSQLLGARKNIMTSI